MAKTDVTVPPDIIEEILKRLPAKPLVRFKCVSKEWKTLISSVRFIKNHIDSSTRLSREKLIILADNLTLYSVDLIDLKKDNVSELMATKVRLDSRFTAMECWCNGLIATSLVPGKKNTMLLVNPTTGEFKEVSPKCVLMPEDHRVVAVDVPGFGYDSLNDDYKFVCVVHCSVENVEGKPVQLVLVHSLKNNSFRMDIKLPDSYVCFDKLKSVYLNGCIHWLCNRGSLSSSFIAIFDLQLEEFKETGVPRLENVISFKSLDVFGGCLCVVAAIGNDFADGFPMEIWVMKEYGVSESWMKISIDGLDPLRVMPLYLLGNREVLIMVLRVDGDLDRLVVYNEDNNTIRKVKISGVPTNMFRIEGTCVESLVSPKHLYE